jgi:hypothetical protein
MLKLSKSISSVSSLPLENDNEKKIKTSISTNSIVNVDLSEVVMNDGVGVGDDDDDDAVDDDELPIKQTTVDRKKQYIWSTGACKHSSWENRIRKLAATNYITLSSSSSISKSSSSSSSSHAILISSAPSSSSLSFTEELENDNDNLNIKTIETLLLDELTLIGKMKAKKFTNRFS